MTRWKMSDVKAKGIFVDGNGIGKKLVPVKKKIITQKQIDKALKRAKQKAEGKCAVDGKSFIHFYLKSIEVDFETEYVFSKDRKFRFDFCIPDQKIAIEYEGLMSEKSRHTTIAGYTVDTEKYNLALNEGWKVYRYTATTFKNIVNDVKKQ